MSYIDKIYVSRRKRAICRLKVHKNFGPILINKAQMAKYFYESDYRFTIKLTNLLEIFNLSKSFSFNCRITGGGKSAQYDSILHAAAKALKAKLREEFSEDETTYKKMAALLRKSGYLTTDTRKVEPKKYGMRKARAKEQFVRR